MLMQIIYLMNDCTCFQKSCTTVDNDRPWKPQYSVAFSEWRTVEKNELKFSHIAILFL